MPDLFGTTKRVSVTVVAATDRAPEDIHLAVTAAVSDLMPVISTDVHGFDLADADDDEPLVQLVVDPAGGLLGTYVDNRDRADELARNCSAVVVELLADADYRAGSNDQ